MKAKALRKRNSLLLSTKDKKSASIQSTKFQIFGNKFSSYAKSILNYFAPTIKDRNYKSKKKSDQLKKQKGRNDYQFITSIELSKKQIINQINVNIEKSKRIQLKKLFQMQGLKINQIINDDLQLWEINNIIKDIQIGSFQQKYEQQQTLSVQTKSQLWKKYTSSYFCHLFCKDKGCKHLEAPQKFGNLQKQQRQRQIQLKQNGQLYQQEKCDNRLLQSNICNNSRNQMLQNKYKQLQISSHDEQYNNQIRQNQLSQQKQKRYKQSSSNNTANQREKENANKAFQQMQQLDQLCIQIPPPYNKKQTSFNEDKPKIDEKLNLKCKRLKQKKKNNNNQFRSKVLVLQQNQKLKRTEYDEPQLQDNVYHSIHGQIQQKISNKSSEIKEKTVNSLYNQCQHQQKIQITNNQKYTNSDQYKSQLQINNPNFMSVQQYCARYPFCQDKIIQTLNIKDIQKIIQTNLRSCLSLTKNYYPNVEYSFPSKNINQYPQQQIISHQKKQIKEVSKKQQQNKNQTQKQSYDQKSHKKSNMDSLNSPAQQNNIINSNNLIIDINIPQNSPIKQSHVIVQKVNQPGHDLQKMITQNPFLKKTQQTLNLLPKIFQNIHNINIFGIKKQQKQQYGFNLFQNTKILQLSKQKKQQNNTIEINPKINEEIFLFKLSENKEKPILSTTNQNNFGSNTTLSNGLIIKISEYDNIGNQPSPMIDQNQQAQFMKQNKNNGQIFVNNIHDSGSYFIYQNVQNPINSQTINQFQKDISNKTFQIAPQRALGMFSTNNYSKNQSLWEINSDNVQNKGSKLAQNHDTKRKKGKNRRVHG